MQRSETHRYANRYRQPDQRRWGRAHVRPRMMGYGLTAFTHPTQSRHSERRMGAAQRNPSIPTPAKRPITSGAQWVAACARSRTMGYGLTAFTHPTARLPFDRPWVVSHGADGAPQSGQSAACPHADRSKSRDPSIRVDGKNGGHGLAAFTHLTQSRHSERRMGVAQRNPSIPTPAKCPITGAAQWVAACARPRMMGYGLTASTHPTARYGCATSQMEKLRLFSGKVPSTVTL